MDSFFLTELRDALQNLNPSDFLSIWKRSALLLGEFEGMCDDVARQPLQDLVELMTGPEREQEKRQRESFERMMRPFDPRQAPVWSHAPEPKPPSQQNRWYSVEAERLRGIVTAAVNKLRKEHGTDDSGAAHPPRSADDLITIEQLSEQVQIPYSTLTSWRLKLPEKQRPQPVKKDDHRRDLYRRRDWDGILAANGTS